MQVNVVRSYQLIHVFTNIHFWYKCLQYMTVYNTYFIKKTPCIAILNNCVSIKGTKSTLVVVYLSAWISERIFNLSFININYTIFNFFFVKYTPDLFSASAFLIYFQNYYITVIKWKLNVMIFDRLFSKLWKLRKHTYADHFC